MGRRAVRRPLPETLTMQPIAAALARVTATAPNNYALFAIDGRIDPHSLRPFGEKGRG